VSAEPAPRTQVPRRLVLVGRFPGLVVIRLTLTGLGFRGAGGKPPRRAGQVVRLPARSARLWPGLRPRGDDLVRSENLALRQPWWQPPSTSRGAFAPPVPIAVEHTELLTSGDGFLVRPCPDARHWPKLAAEPAQARGRMRRRHRLALKRPEPQLSGKVLRATSGLPRP
jgi:hypothetical protein